MAQLGLVNPRTPAGAAVRHSSRGNQAWLRAGHRPGATRSSGSGAPAQAGLLGQQYGIQQQTLAGQEQLAGTQYGLSQQDTRRLRKHSRPSLTGTRWRTPQADSPLRGPGTLREPKQAISTNAFQNTQAQQAIQRTGIGEQAQYGFQQQQFGLEQQGEAAQQQYSLGNIARGEAGLGLSAQANGLSARQPINQINYGMQQAGPSGSAVRRPAVRPTRAGSGSGSHLHRPVLREVAGLLGWSESQSGNVRDQSDG